MAIPYHSRFYVWQTRSYCNRSSLLLLKSTNAHALEWTHINVSISQQWYWSKDLGGRSTFPTCGKYHFSQEGDVTSKFSGIPKCPNKPAYPFIRDAVPPDKFRAFNGAWALHIQNKVHGNNGWGRRTISLQHSSPGSCAHGASVELPVLQRSGNVGMRSHLARLV